MCNGKAGKGCWLAQEPPVSFLSSSDPSHMIYIVLKGQANNSGHSSFLVYLFEFELREGKFWPQKAEPSSSCFPIASCPCSLRLRIRGSAHQNTAGQACPAYPNLLITVSCMGVLSPSVLFSCVSSSPAEDSWLSGWHLQLDTCWSETCCSSKDPVCLV